MSATVSGDALPRPEKLDRAEIWRRYPNEWVVLVDMERRDMTTVAGVVYAHSPSRAEAREAARGLHEAGIFWTGPIRSPIWWKLGLDRAV